MTIENKPIILRIADIYLRFPEIMEEEADDLAEFLEDEHIVYEGATDLVYDLQVNNQKLNDQLDRELIKRARLEDRINKAIAYIEQLEHSDWVSFGRTILLDILKGE